MEHGDELVGMVLGKVTFPIEAGKAREFAKSIHNPNSVFRDAAAAKQAGFPAIPAPSTHSVVAALDERHVAPAGGSAPSLIANAAPSVHRVPTGNRGQQWRR